MKDTGIHDGSHVYWALWDTPIPPSAGNEGYGAAFGKVGSAEIRPVAMARLLGSAGEGVLIVCSVLFPLTVTPEWLGADPGHLRPQELEGPAAL
jgi:hypothetical protein